MNNIKHRTIKYTIFSIIGVIMFGASEIFKFKDAFWSGMGIGFVIISVIKLVQLYRYKNDSSYAEKTSVQVNDERNRFIAEKARSLVFYLFIMISAAIMIVLRILDFDQESSIVGYAICLQIIIYWVGYYWLQHKY